MVWLQTSAGISFALCFSVMSVFYFALVWGPCWPSAEGTGAPGSALCTHALSCSTLCPVHLPWASVPACQQPVTASSATESPSSPSLLRGLRCPPPKALSWDRAPWCTAPGAGFAIQLWSTLLTPSLLLLSLPTSPSMLSADCSLKPLTLWKTGGFSLFAIFSWESHQ